jgi:3-hydroxyisobutyrate dehydrogenase
LGAIGSGIARLLAEAGLDVVGYDVNADALAALDGVVSPAVSPAALGETADVVVLAVYDDAQVRDVLTGADGILQAGRPPQVVVVVTTVSVATIDWAATAAAPAGTRIVDCGVAGGIALRSGKRIVSMVGGDEEAIRVAQPVLDAFGSPVLHMGLLGSGMRAKLARNLLLYSSVLAEWEAARLAEAAGIDAARFVELVRASEPWSVGRITTVPLDADLSKEQMYAEYACKDLRAALELGSELGVDLRIASVAGEMFDDALDRSRA